MRRQVSLLVAVISTAIVASFVVPLLLLVRTMAEDRGLAAAHEQANTVAVLVASLNEDPRLAELLQPTLTRPPALTSVVLANGAVLGEPWPDASTDPELQRAQAGEAFSVRDAVGARVYVPVVVDGGVAVTRATMTSDQLAEGVDLAWASIIALGLLLSALAVFFAAQAGRAVSRPLLAVAATAHRLREGDLTARAPLAGTPETVELGSALNGLAGRISELLHAEREHVRELAHRLRTPVTALRLEAEQVTDPRQRAELANSVLQLQVAIDEVVREARRPLREDLPVGCDAAGVVAGRVAWWRPLAEDQGRTLAFDLPPGEVPVSLSELELADLVDICIDNVFAHTAEGVGFAVSLAARDGSIELSIRDEGQGFAVAAGERRPGTSGLGLALAGRLVERAGGRLELSAPGAPGAEVRVVLPGS